MVCLCNACCPVLPECGVVGAVENKAGVQGELRLAEHEWVYPAGSPCWILRISIPLLRRTVGLPGNFSRRLTCGFLSRRRRATRTLSRGRYLQEAANRDIVLAVVLNRVPSGVGTQIRPDFARRLNERGLGSAPLFVVSEAVDSDGLIPEANVESLRRWLRGITEDSASRVSVARQTLAGAVDALLEREDDILTALGEQLALRERMDRDVDEVFLAW